MWQKETNPHRTLNMVPSPPKCRMWCVNNESRQLHHLQPINVCHPVVSTGLMWGFFAICSFRLNRMWVWSAITCNKGVKVIILFGMKTNKLAGVSWFDRTWRHSVLLKAFGWKIKSNQHLVDNNGFTLDKNINPDKEEILNKMEIKSKQQQQQQCVNGCSWDVLCDFHFCDHWFFSGRITLMTSSTWAHWKYLLCNEFDHRTKCWSLRSER